MCACVCGHVSVYLHQLNTRCAIAYTIDVKSRWFTAKYAPFVFGWFGNSCSSTAICIKASECIDRSKLWKAESKFRCFSFEFMPPSSGFFSHSIRYRGNNKKNYRKRIWSIKSVHQMKSYVFCCTVFLLQLPLMLLLCCCCCCCCTRPPFSMPLWS